MSEPIEYVPLFDTIIHAAGNPDTGELVYGVELVGLYRDGPDVPEHIGGSALFDDPEQALDWARGAIEAFNAEIDGDEEKQT